MLEVAGMPGHGPYAPELACRWVQLVLLIGSWLSPGAAYPVARCLAIASCLAVARCLVAAGCSLLNDATPCPRDRAVNASR